MVLSDPRQPDAPIIYCNPAFCEQTGYPEDEVIGRNCRFLQGPATDRTTVKRIAEALSARENVMEEIYNYRRDGRGYWNALHVSPIFDAHGQLLYFFGSQADVTRRKEAALQQQERLDTVGTMASGVAHAFNNLMTIVVASIDQAATQASTDRQRMQLARADAAARSAGRLTQQMLSFSRRQFLEEQSVNLNVAIRNLDVLIDEMVEDAVSVEFDLAAEPVPARLDVGQLELAVIAVVRNAADAMPKGGRITIATREYRSWDADEGQSGQSVVELSVADKGDGMLPEVAQRATEPFFTTKSEGTGLGLSMVQGFVEQSRGRMRIETGAGQGTTVHLVFPKHVDSSSPSRTSPS
jgi:PAS domain S-box-containing protein